MGRLEKSILLTQNKNGAGNMKKKIGRSSIIFKDEVTILNSASIVGKKEGEGPLGELFDLVGSDDLFGCGSWEDAESTLQKEAVKFALEKASVKAEDISFLFAGDLLGQSIATSFGIASYEIPFFGVYGACSTCGEALALGSMSIAAGYADKVLCVTSSHFASAEKEFRFPLEYGNQRPLSATWTVTGSGAFVLSSAGREDEKSGGRHLAKPRAKISGITVGKIVDFGLKDSMNMGACMAPAAAETIERHLTDFQAKPEEYDRIITGDLGVVGSHVLIDLLQKKGIDISQMHMDCGIEIFDAAKQDTHAGGSGCGCSAVTLSAYILKMIEEGAWHKVLFAPTGALLSKTSFNEGKSIPGICHGVVIERC